MMTYCSAAPLEYCERRYAAAAYLNDECKGNSVTSDIVKSAVLVAGRSRPKGEASNWRQMASLSWSYVVDGWAFQLIYSVSLFAFAGATTCIACSSGLFCSTTGVVTFSNIYIVFCIEQSTCRRHHSNRSLSLIWHERKYNTDSLCARRCCRSGLHIVRGRIVCCSLR